MFAHTSSSSSTVLHPPPTSSIPPPPSLPFFFRRRAGALNWSALHSLNLDQLIRTVDIATLQAHLDNLAFSDLSAADLPHLHPSSLLHLFRLLQLTVEYLLHVQSFLYHAHAAKEYETELLAKKCVDVREEARDKLKKRAKELKDVKRELAAAKAAIPSSPVKRRPSPPAVALDGHVYACAECDAAFISAAYLTSHVQRRHGGGEEARRCQGGGE